jgi:geranylgeranyl transferase type-2 subunit beta
MIVMVARSLCLVIVAQAWEYKLNQAAEPAAAERVLKDLHEFCARTANRDGSFRPGIDPKYEGMADSAASDLAPVTYAVIVHKTFGWKLPDEKRTIQFLLERQQNDGAFFNVAGTDDPKTASARVYNTTQGIVALHALGIQPKYDPSPVFEHVMQGDYKELPPYSTSFFPLAYRATGKTWPKKFDERVRALMVQADDGYLNNHIAATFHAVHYYSLLGEATPKAEAIVRRTLAEQKPDGSWLLNPPARDRHAGFDAVFTLKHLGGDSPDCRKAIAAAAEWALACRNEDGGFGHYPCSPSDADANYFQVGILVMSGYLKTVDPPPPDPELLGWGHLMPAARRAADRR